MAYKKNIPNDLSKKFGTVEGRRELIEKYGDSPNMYVGENEDGEKVIVSISRKKGIVVRTYQSNHFVRVNYYDKEGFDAGETYDGRWTEEFK